MLTACKLFKPSTAQCRPKASNLSTKRASKCRTSDQPQFRTRSSFLERQTRATGLQRITRRNYQLLPRSVEQILEKLLLDSVTKLFPSVELNEKMSMVDVSPIGDYRTSIAFQLAHKVKRKPAEVASMLVEDMKTHDTEERKVLSEVEATGQGFVSFTLNTSWIVHQSTHEAMQKLKAIKRPTRRVVIDHGSPNMSKEFHVGHLRSIMIGDCLARILRYQGHHVETVSHVGDFGTPMGLVIAHAMRTRKWAFDPPESEALPSPAELSELYIEAKSKQKTDPELAALIVHCVTEFQKLDQTKADPHVMRVYRQICEASREGFNDVYKDLNVVIPEKGESFYGQYIPDTIAELQNKGLVTPSDGALVCKLDSWKAPLIIEKSDKTWLYGTTDLAALRWRLREGAFDDLLYVVDFTQHQHFEQVYEVARKAGWYDPKKTRVEHVHFGVVQGSNGQKLSSRDGTPLKLRQLLDDAVVETRAALITARSLVRSDRQDQDVEPTSVDEKLAEPTRFGKLGDSQAYISPASRALAEENAPIVAYNAIKYFELAQTRTQNYIFSFQSMLSFKGNTSFYIIYAYARIHTLYRRAADQGVAIPELSTDSTMAMTEEELNAISPKERDLALKLLQFADVVASVEVSLMPHTLSTYLFQTSQKFHSFYENCRVIGSTNQDFRFKLCKATEQILGKGLELLNVQTVDHV